MYIHTYIYAYTYICGCYLRFTMCIIFGLSLERGVLCVYVCLCVSHIYSYISIMMTMSMSNPLYIFLLFTFISAPFSDHFGAISRCKYYQISGLDL